MRPREIGTVLAALSELREEGEQALEPASAAGAPRAPHGPPAPHAPRSWVIGDLEELLAQRPLEGMLILEAGRVPGEDIGFVRRFLERHGGWRLVVIGEETQDPRARALLALPRAQWLPWPPDLEQLRALLGPSPPTRERPEARAGSARRSGRRANEPGPRATGGVDVGDLVEELLAAAALQGETPPRYQFKSAESLFLQRERGTLVDGLSGLVELARCCAGADGLVRAAVDPGGDPAGDTVRIGIDFPLAGLSEKDLPVLFERPGAELAAELGANPALAALSDGLQAARRSAAVLREAGGRVELVPEQPGRVRCEVRIASRAGGNAAREAGTRSKPDDPFA